MVRALLALSVALLVASSAWATLPPEAYEQLRQTAPIVLGGVVQHDAGGQAMVRVEHVGRGSVQVGSMVTVLYPEDRGQMAVPGASVYYRRFAPGTRIMAYGQGVPTLHTVHGGIDVVSMPRPRPKQGGCASCTVAAAAGGGPASWLGGLLLLVLAWRRSTTIGR